METASYHPSAVPVDNNTHHIFLLHAIHFIIHTSIREREKEEEVTEKTAPNTQNSKCNLHFEKRGSARQNCFHGSVFLMF